jgi:hypothetical protein
MTNESCTIRGKENLMHHAGCYPSQSVSISPKKSKLKFVKIQEKEFDQTTNLTVKTSLKLQSNFTRRF